MNGFLDLAGRTGLWLALGMCALMACNAPPQPTGSSTGGLTASGSVVDEVRRATDRSSARSEVVTLPSGERMRRVTVPNGFSHVLLGKRGPDGKPSITCVDSAPEAEAFLATERPKTTQGEAQ